MINILLVEDDPSVCQFITQALCDCSSAKMFNVETAADLAGAVEHLNRSTIDIILLDLQLPDSDGIKAVKKINTSKPHVPIIAMLESADEEIGEQAITNGADDYLVKGKIFKDVLRRSIHYAVKLKKERQQTEERLARLIEDLETSNKELKDFAYVVSHDLKAPLRAIKTLVDWLVADHADKIGQDGKEQMDMLSSRVDRMHNLIDGVLQYSRVGRVKEKSMEVNLNRLVPEIIETIRPAENIEIDIEDELPTILFEQTRITQVFQNLLSNAVKYMDKPNGRIKIGCTEENDYWKFYVADNGVGITEKNFDKIFQIFQTLNARDKLESTGVGLTIVKKIIEIYGGKIWVESEVGAGSTFLFTVPIVKQETAEETVLVDNVKA